MNKTIELIRAAVEVQYTEKNGPARDTALALLGVLQSLKGDHEYLEFLAKRPLK